MGRNTSRINIGKLVTIEGVVTKAIIDAVNKRKEAAFLRTSPEWLAVARREVPVYSGDDPRANPGALMASIVSGITRDGNMFLAAGGAGAKHAHLVEYGTVNMPANPFMRRSKGIILKGLKKTLMEELGKVPLIAE